MNPYRDYYIIRIILALLFLLAVAADIYLIVIVSKFKTIQTNANLLFRSAAWCHLCSILLGSTVFVIVSFLSYGVHHIAIFFLQNVDYICLGMVYFILAFIAVDWAVSQYYPVFRENHPKLFNKGVLVSFLLLLPEMLMTSFACYEMELQDLQFIRFLFKTVSFFACFVVLLILFIIKKLKPPPTDDPKAEYRLTVPCAYYLMVLPSVVHACFVVSYDKHFIDIVFEGRASIVGDLTSAIFILAPIVMVFLLGRTSKYFRTAYIRCCKRKAVEGYADDNLDDAEPAEQGPPVTFQKIFETVHI
ncbi:hypothetical protein GWI33_007551 [Rhynchophorus ferrugineus]|uniref:Uncharacterized protein n=1 Tax=Rhynchophorus ferrugineus TaxID=354439 RepID=A0A834IDA3_RHYFE|nr:hypothetical protein GWI33_007551 [Rhynchophorus ferrugineus]